MVHIISEITAVVTSKYHEYTPVHDFLKCTKIISNKSSLISFVTQNSSYFSILQNNNLSEFDKNMLCL